MSNTPPDLRSHLTDLLHAALQIVAPGAGAVPVVLERPKSLQHGDYASSLAMQLAKPMKRNPREIAQALVTALPASPFLDKAEVAGSGIVKLYFKPPGKQTGRHSGVGNKSALRPGKLGNGSKGQDGFFLAKQN